MCYEPEPDNGCRGAVVGFGLVVAAVFVALVVALIRSLV